MPDSFIGALLAALLGGVIAYVNYRLTAHASDNPNERFAVVSIVRQLLNLGYLAAVFFLAPYTPWDRIWMLAGAVVGLTLPTLIFTFLLLRRLKGNTGDEENKGGES